jgi:transposase-like protein
MQVIEQADTSALREVLVAHVTPGAAVLTDGWAPYVAACGQEYEHRPETISGSGLKAHELLPGVHRITALAKRWLPGAHQGGVKPEHLQAYLDEFTFRFNRRRSRARGMLFYRLLEQAVLAQPRTYRSLVAGAGASGRPDPTPPPADKRIRPSSLAGPPLDRPWRTRS